MASASLLKIDSPGCGRRSTGSIGAEPPAPGGREGRGAHRDHLLGVGRLHRLDGVAGVDRTLERVGRNHFRDFRHLRHVEQRRDARQHVLAGRGRWRRRWRHRSAASATIRSASGSARPWAKALRRRPRTFSTPASFDAACAAPATRARRPGYAPGRRVQRRRQRLGGDVVEMAVVDFGKEKNRHQSTPASSLSLATSSATEPTFTPALRPAARWSSAPSGAA